ncbi:protein ACCELERATED CELL DEATH 6-like [Telopea speciosissima]|uniref:protein ACCELERATED CELL DEATH 6-like n=1 Tax=Telopea speciosissima TaxID=54955 RepID=UPI001CC3C731|nr:protein ACCELERATED CELL DEATH 6-like [Telopea speciosissima]
MEPQVYAAAVAGEEHILSMMETQLLQQVSPQGNTVAHMAASLGHNSILELLLQRCPTLLFKPNSKGNTPLHVAETAGRLSIVKFLLDCNSKDIERGDEANNQEQYLRMQNTIGNTVLHEAMENNHEDVARTLVTADPVLSHLVNKEGKSPAYLAAEAGHLQLLEHMLGLLVDSDDPGDWRRSGKTLLHVAIIKKHREIMKIVLKFKPQLIQLRDAQKRTPLHYAARLNFWDGLNVLLDMDTSAVYQSDDKGFFPIHVAAREGHTKILQLLIKRCPGSWELLTEQEQENALHVAAKSGKVEMVGYILKNPMLEKLLNEKEKDGNTPLHLAAMAGHYKVVHVLTRDVRVNLCLKNYNKLTALNISEANRINKQGSHSTLKAKGDLTWMRLIAVGAPEIEELDLFETQEPPNPKELLDYYKDWIDTLMVVSTLILTITFTAGLTVPGGLNSDGPNKGMALMLRKATFHVFMLSDTLAMYCALICVVTLLWAKIRDFKLILYTINSFALPFLSLSLLLMSIAFGAGVCLVTSGLAWLAIVVLVMNIISLIYMVFILIPLLWPYVHQKRVQMLILYHLYRMVVSMFEFSGIFVV